MIVLGDEIAPRARRRRRQRVNRWLTDGLIIAAGWAAMALWWAV